MTPPEYVEMAEAFQAGQSGLINRQDFQAKAVFSDTNITDG
jgi:hypothetical protein